MMCTVSIMIHNSLTDGPLKDFKISMEPPLQGILEQMAKKTQCSILVYLRKTIFGGPFCFRINGKPLGVTNISSIVYLSFYGGGGI